MTTPDLNKLLRKATETLNEAIEADNKGDKPSAYRNYKEAFKQLNNYREEFDKKYQHLYNKAEKIERELNAGSSIADTAQLWPSRTYSSPKLRHFVKLNNVKLDDVAGHKECKQVLTEAAIWPKKYPQFFTGTRKPWRAVLLFGPPGSGKTLLAKAIAATANYHFASISPSAIVSKWMGESEQHVKDLFQEAREKKPSIIFIDEFDSLCGLRGENNENEASRRIKSELLVHMQDVCDGGEHVLILAATNTPQALDKAILRRFDLRIYIPLPDEKARKRIFKIQIGKTPSEIDDNGLQRLAKETEGFSGSDISSYVKDALYEPVRATLRADYFTQTTDQKWEPCQKTARDKRTLHELEKERHNIKVPKVTFADFKKVKDNHKPTVNGGELNKLVEFDKKYGVSGKM